MENSHFVNNIGKGTIGVVDLYRGFKDNKIFALRKIDEKDVSSEIKNYIENEVMFLKGLSHQYILHYLDFQTTPKEYKIGMEYCSGGSISKCLQKYKNLYKRPFTEEIVQHLMKEIVEGVKYLHKNGIIHRDLRNENIYAIFYDTEKDDYNKMNMMKASIRIGDFGFASRENDSNFLNKSYTDPKILKKYKDRVLLNIDTKDKSYDIRALGALCYEMVTGAKIFKYKNTNELFQNAAKHSIVSLSNEIMNFLNLMLNYNLNPKPTIEQLSNHAFLTKDIKKFIQIDLIPKRTRSDQHTRIIPSGNKMITINSDITDFSNVSENIGSRGIALQTFQNKSKQMEKLNGIQNHYNNIIGNKQNQFINNNYQKQPNNRNQIYNNKNLQQQNYLARSMIPSKIPSLSSSSSTIINNSSSYTEFNSQNSNIKNHTISDQFNSQKNFSQKSNATTNNSTIPPKANDLPIKKFYSSDMIHYRSPYQQNFNK